MYSNFCHVLRCLMDSFNRQACFNELSFLDKDDNEDSFFIFSNFAKTIKALKAKGFSGIRYEHGITSLTNENLRNIFNLRNNPKGKILFERFTEKAINIISTAQKEAADSQTYKI